MNRDKKRNREREGDNEHTRQRRKEDRRKQIGYNEEIRNDGLYVGHL